MAKLTRFQRSQNAHERLIRKASDIPGIDGKIKSTYHKKIFDRQKAKGSVISKEERKMEFDSIKSFLTRDTRKQKSYAEIMNEHLKYGRYK